MFIFFISIWFVRITTILIVRLSLKKYSDDLLRYFGIFVSKDNKCVPSIYWSPALHKNSTKAIFIITAVACSENPLPKYVTSVFELL